MPPREHLHFATGDRQPPWSQTLVLVGGAAIVGIATGLLGAAFLYALQQGDAARLALTERLHQGPPLFGWFVLVSLTSSAAAIGAWLVVRFAPTAAGSGVPYVEKILRGHDVPRHAGVLPVKFVGGILAISSGLLLGREGPMVQMGAVIGEKIGRLFPGVEDAWKSLMTAGAGAGLATAFNAPIGGTVFILEEVQRRVTPLAFILATTATVSATLVQRGIFHASQDFHVAVSPVVSPDSVWMFALFGAGLGLVGVFYNRLLLALVGLNSRLARIPVAARAGAVGLVVGTVGWFQPSWIGGGDDITKSVLSGAPMLLLGLVAARFLLGPLSYAASTPGGFFAPIITLGACLGIAFGVSLQSFAPDLAIPPLAFAVAGMAAFFTATIRAPVTGLFICLEMTGSYGLGFPMLAACLGAFLIPTLAGSPPIYDSLASIGSSQKPTNHATLRE